MDTDPNYLSFIKPRSRNPGRNKSLQNLLKCFILQKGNDQIQDWMGKVHLKEFTPLICARISEESTSSSSSFIPICLGKYKREKKLMGCMPHLVSHTGNRSDLTSSSSSSSWCPPLALGASPKSSFLANLPLTRGLLSASVLRHAYCIIIIIFF